MAQPITSHDDAPPTPGGGGFLIGGGSTSGGIYRPVAGVVYDGRHTTAQPSGGPEYSAPFPIDPARYLYTQEYWVEHPNFVSLPLDSGGPYGGVHVGESNFKDLGGGILSFTREFALVPAARNEYESFVYSYQDVLFSPTVSLAETPLTVPTRVQYDYFHTTDPTGISLPKAPKAILVFDEIYEINGWGSLVVGQEYLAEDATMRCWKGHIYERQQRFFRYRNLLGEGPAFP